MSLNQLFIAATFIALATACSGAGITSSNLCPDPSRYCEGNTLVRCTTSTSGVVPVPVLSETDCGASDRFCVPEPDGASCR
jgi:hypothetical protein